MCIHRYTRAYMLTCTHAHPNPQQHCKFFEWTCIHHTPDSMPSTRLSTLHTLQYINNSQKPCEVSTIITSTLQIRKLRLRSHN